MNTHNRKSVLVAVIVIPIVAIVIVVFLQSSSPSPTPISDLNELEASVRRMTAAIRTVLQTEKFDNDPTGEQLLDRYFSKRPDLREVFRDISISVWHDEKNVVLLFSSPDGICWFEDSSKTPKVDRPCYLDDPPSSADFTLISTDTPSRQRNGPE